MPLNPADPSYLSFEKMVLPVAVERGMGIQAMKSTANSRTAARIPPERLPFLCAQFADSLPGGRMHDHRPDRRRRPDRTAFKPMPSEEMAQAARQRRAGFGGPAWRTGSATLRRPPPHRAVSGRSARLNPFIFDLCVILSSVSRSISYPNPGFVGADVTIFVNPNPVLNIRLVSDALRVGHLEPDAVGHGHLAMEMDGVIECGPPVVRVAFHSETFGQASDFHSSADSTDVIDDETHDVHGSAADVRGELVRRE